jgi:hypothetical protein
MRWTAAGIPAVDVARIVVPAGTSNGGNETLPPYAPADGSGCVEPAEERV